VLESSETLWAERAMCKICFVAPRVAAVRKKSYTSTITEDLEKRLLVSPHWVEIVPKTRITRQNRRFRVRSWLIFECEF